jgi:hypothetical protein
VRGAAAGVVAAAAWAAGEPVFKRIFGTSFSDVRLVGRVATRGRAWPAAGLAIHLANGAVFGAVFEKAGLTGVRAGVVTAQIENLVLWPAMAIVDRIHPDRRDGTWPRLLTSRRIAAQEVAAHALFGVVLGALTRR